MVESVESAQIENDDDLLQSSCSYRLPVTSRISGISSNTVPSPCPALVASRNNIESPVEPIELQSTTNWAEINAPDSSSGRRAEVEQHISDDQQLHQQVISIANGTPAQIEQQQQDQANEVRFTYKITTKYCRCA